MHLISHLGENRIDHRGKPPGPGSKKKQHPYFPSYAAILPYLYPCSQLLGHFYGNSICYQPFQ